MSTRTARVTMPSFAPAVENLFLATNWRSPSSGMSSRRIEHCPAAVQERDDDGIREEDDQAQRTRLASKLVDLDRNQRAGCDDGKPTCPRLSGGTGECFA